MTKPNKQFRFERKYLLDTNTAHVLKQRISSVLKPDDASPDGRYRISTLYFDDLYNTAFFEKQNGILKRDKFRVRYYNDSLEMIRLERKHKHGEMVYKEGALISQKQYQMMRGGEYDFMKQDPALVFAEFYTVHALKHLRPVVLVEYDRQAFLYPYGNVRITFDSGLRARAPASERSFSPERAALPDKNVILEVKYDRFIPSLITGLFSGLQLTQQLALSKFALAKLTLT